VIQFTVPGNPVPKARARTLKNGHTYTPKTTEQYEIAVATAAMAAKLVLRPGHVGYSVECHFYLSARYWSVDIDNLIKSLLDGLGRYGKPYGWRDSQVVKMREPTKHLCPKGEERTEIKIWEALM